jgi:hypothetical protein
MGKHWEENELDAYGHLNWTVGNEDWTACFDAIRVGGSVKYHVVVNCESGGFIDTIETGEHPVERAVEALRGLPDYWVGICIEHYAHEEGRDDPDSEFYISDEETQRCAASWLAHLNDLVSGPPRDEPEADEEDEGFDPIRDGWVGKNGLP